MKKWFRSVLIGPVSRFVGLVLADLGYSQHPVSLVHKHLRVQAAQRAAEIVESQMKSALIFPNRESLWLATIGRTKTGAMEDEGGAGLVLEFGVFRGESLSFFADNLAQIVFGFDTFEGLQEDWPGTSLQKGYFAQKRLPKVPKNAQLVVGRTQETLPGFLDDNAGPVAIAHFDLDTYLSTLETLRIIRPRLTTGTLIIFDEYMGIPLWEEGEYKAWSEFVSETGLRYRFFGTTGVQVAIEVLGL